QDFYSFDLPEDKKFDACFAFQVLEHVDDPYRFFQAMLRMVKLGGKIGVAVPNARAFVGRTNSLLDMPPHHVTRWVPRSFEVIAQSLHVSISRVLEAPLEPIHVPWYVSIRFQELRARFGCLVANPFTSKLTLLALQLGLRRM